MVIAELTSLANTLFGGFGQTKIIGDCLKSLRVHEQGDVTNKKIEPFRQYASMQSDGVLALHKGVEATPPTVAVAGSVPSTTFSPFGRKPSVDGLSITRPAIWPTLSAQSSQVLGPEQCLLRHCERHDCWDDVALCWQSVLLPPGTVFAPVYLSAY